MIVIVGECEVGPEEWQTTNVLSSSGCYVTQDQWLGPLHGCDEMLQYHHFLSSPAAPLSAQLCSGHWSLISWSWYSFTWHSHGWLEAVSVEVKLWFIIIFWQCGAVWLVTGKCVVTMQTSTWYMTLKYLPCTEHAPAPPVCTHGSVTLSVSWGCVYIIVRPAQFVDIHSHGPVVSAWLVSTQYKGGISLVRQTQEKLSEWWWEWTQQWSQVREWVSIIVVSVPQPQWCQWPWSSQWQQAPSQEVPS